MQIRGEQPDSLNDIRLTLFMTDGMSIKKWAEYGMLDREISLYSRLANKLSCIQIYSYGTNKDLNYLKNEHRITVLPWISNRGIKYYSDIGPYLHYFKLRNTDIIKTNQISGALSAVKAKNICNKPLIVRCCYVWSDFAIKRNDTQEVIQAAERTERISFNEADKIIVTCMRDKNYIIKKYNLYDDKINIIPNYVDIEMFKPIIRVNKIPGRVCFVGRLDGQKNLFSLFNAIESVEKVKELLIIGDGPLKDELVIKANNLSTKVTFSGIIPNLDLPEIIQSAEVFILPSLYEGMPKTLLEAMSCGMPCIGANSDGIKEIINHKENGLLCEKDEFSIANSIKLLFEDHKLRKEIGNNARMEIERNYNLDNVVELELNIYRELLNIN